MCDSSHSTFVSLPDFGHYRGGEYADKNEHRRGYGGPFAEVLKRQDGAESCVLHADLDAERTSSGQVKPAGGAQTKAG